MDNNIIGQKVNHLTILDIEYRQMTNQKRKFYKCQCDCGNITYVRSDLLFNNHTTSCGCYKLKLFKENRNNNFKDLTNQTFGKLTVIKLDEEYNKQKEHEHIKWICQCSCGNIVSVFASNLTRLHTTSCGCTNRSIGEENIEKILKENNINYIREYSFEDLKDKAKLRFDFAIFDNKNNLIELIEFDGRQHNNEYTPWKNTIPLSERQAHDNLKNNYCKEKNIKLVRIDYSKRDNLTLKDLELI